MGALHRIGLVGLLFAGWVAMSAPAASAVTVSGLTVQGCFGAQAGCSAVPGGPLNGASAVLAVNGSVYVTGTPSTATTPQPLGFVSHFFAGTGGVLSYDGCVSDDGDGGACLDIPGAGAPLSAPRRLAISPNGRSLYVLDTGATNVAHLIAAPAGQLSWDACVSDPAGAAGTCGIAQPGNPAVFVGASGLAVSPLASAPNSSVYTSADGVTVTDGVVSHLFADPVTGQLNYDGCDGDDGNLGDCTEDASGGAAIGQGSTLAVNPTGSAVYVANPAGIISQLATLPAGGGGVTSFVGCRDRDVTQGCAQGPVAGNPLVGAQGVVVSPDGGAVYVASSLIGTVSHFFADPTGKQLLSWDGCVSDGGSADACAPGPQTGDPLAGVDALAISPDGRTLYAVSPTTGSVSWFAVAAQGQITFAGCVSDDKVPGCTNVAGGVLDGARSVAVSPDGTALYVASSKAGTLTSFAVQTAGGGTGGTGGSGGSGGGAGSGGAGGGGAGGSSSGKLPVRSSTRQLKLTHTPARPPAGRPVTVTFRVTFKRRPVRRAEVNFAGHDGQTGSRGTVAFRVVLRHRGYTATASAPGRRSTSIRVHAR